MKKIVEKLYVLRKAFLSKYWQIHYSQFGEDVVLKDWINRDVKNGFYVDVGCYHPRKFSNTYFLYKRGWRGINIDLDKIKIDVMNMVRPRDINIVAAISNQIEEMTIYTDIKYSLGSFISSGVVSKDYYSKGKIITNTLDQVLGATKYSDREIDLLSIDTENHDYNVLLSLNIDKYKPKIILIEILDKKNIHKIIDTDVYKYLISKDYRLANWIGHTLFFIHKNSGNLVKSDV